MTCYLCGDVEPKKLESAIPRDFTEFNNKTGNQILVERVKEFYVSSSFFFIELANLTELNTDFFIRFHSSYPDMNIGQIEVRRNSTLIVFVKDKTLHL